MKEQLLNKVEYFVAKGEMALSQEFLLQPQCFEILSAAEASESVSFWEWVYTSTVDSLVHVMGKVHFFLFDLHYCFLNVKVNSAYFLTVY